MAKGLIGRDAIGYTLQRGGVDSAANPNIIPGATYSMLGRWRTARISLSNEWVDVTPSSADWKEKRRSVIDWNGTFEHIVRYGGSPILRMLLNDDYVIGTFIEDASNQPVTIIGGITTGGMSAGKEERTDNLEVENVGMYNNAPSIIYAANPS
jgi:hypothetical protein